MAGDTGEIELSIVMPCLNEADTLATCIGKAHRAFQDAHIVGEIVIADNGSDDGSVEIFINAINDAPVLSFKGITSDQRIATSIMCKKYCVPT